MIISINSIPFTTFPKAEYCLSKCGAESKQIKNWLLALSGSADLAADKTPRVWAMSVNSAFKLGKSDPPVPANDKLKSGLFEFQILHRLCLCHETIYDPMKNYAVIFSRSAKSLNRFT